MSHVQMPPLDPQGEPAARARREGYAKITTVTMDGIAGIIAGALETLKGGTKVMIFLAIFFGALGTAWGKFKDYSAEQQAHRTSMVIHSLQADHDELMRVNQIIARRDQRITELEAAAAQSATNHVSELERANAHVATCERSLTRVTTELRTCNAVNTEVPNPFH